MTPTQMKKEIESLERQNEILLSGCYCPMCDKHMSKDKFYLSTDPRIKSGASFICRKCAEKIARREDENGQFHEPTKASVMEALEYLDRPFINVLWDSSYFESHGETKKRKTDIWGCYIKNVGMKQYKTMRWKDGDNFKKGFNSGFIDSTLPSCEENNLPSKMGEAEDEYVKNRRDVIKKVKYDPFEHYPREDDKPYLYASLIQMLDDDANQDGMKLRAVIEIVQSYNHIRKLNASLDSLLANPENIVSNLPQISKIKSTIKDTISSTNALAKDNGISVNFSSTKSKGANTLSGKIKELSEQKFAGADINTFDIETCKGMLQVAELSEEARHKQIGFDENIAQEIKDIKVELVESLTKERDAAVETMRKLLDENNKLKKFLYERGLTDKDNQVIY